MAAGYLLTALVHGSGAGFVTSQIVAAGGNGVVLVTLSALVVQRAPRDAVGISSGLYALTRTVGGAVAGAVSVAVMSSTLTRLPDGTWTTSEAGYVTVWLVSAAMALTVLGLALRLGTGSEGGAPVDRVP